MKVCFALFLALFVSTVASAQTVTSYTCKVKQGPVTVATITIPATPASCNQPQPTSVLTDNPTTISFDDPAFPASPAPTSRACVYVDPPVTGALALLPFGNIVYTALCAPVNTAGGVTADSLASNGFTRPGVLAPVLTGVKVYR